MLPRSANPDVIFAHCELPNSANVESENIPEMQVHGKASRFWSFWRPQGAQPRNALCSEKAVGADEFHRPLEPFRSCSRSQGFARRLFPSKYRTVCLRLRQS